MRMYTAIRGEVQPHDQVCACGCGLTFRAHYETELYVNGDHQRIARLRRRKERQKARKERQT